MAQPPHGFRNVLLGGRVVAAYLLGQLFGERANLNPPAYVYLGSRYQLHGGCLYFLVAGFRVDHN